MALRFRFCSYLVTVVTAAVLLSPVVVPRVANAGCIQGSTICGSDYIYLPPPSSTIPGVHRTCSARVRCSNTCAHPFFVISNTHSNNVTHCAAPSLVVLGTTFTIIARAPKTYPQTRTCRWRWNATACISRGILELSTSDGLPVELMRFSVE